MIPLLLVRLREFRYAFYAQDVSEVVLCPRLRSFSGLADGVLDGLFRLGEDWIPVVSLANLVHAEPLEQGLYDNLVLVKTDPRFAIRVSAVDGVKKFSWEALQPLDSPVVAGPSAAARLEIEEEPCLLLIASDLLMEKEQQLMRKAAHAMAEREQAATSQLEALTEGGEK